MKTPIIIAISVIVSVVVVFGVLTMLNLQQTALIEASNKRYDEFSLVFLEKDEYYSNEAVKCASNEMFREREPCITNLVNEAFNDVKTTAEKFEIDNEMFEYFWTMMFSDLRYNYKTNTYFPEVPELLGSGSSNYNRLVTKNYIDMLNKGNFTKWYERYPDSQRILDETPIAIFDDMSDYKAPSMFPLQKEEVTVKELLEAGVPLEEHEYICDFFNITDSDVCN